MTLFVERAASVQPEFALTETNAPFIAQICQRLDGIALAIELAASRMKMFKVEQIAARLDDAFGLLTSGNRAALPRQQTLRALIDWSYNLLSEEEKTFLRKLSVFMGGWTLEAAEAVCENKDALELLTHLVDKSLVSVDHKHGDEVRYYLLETIRQYAHEKLMESGDGDSTRERHLEYFMQLAETNEARRKTPEQMLAYQQMRMEFDNFRIALDWSLSEGMVGQNSDKGLRLANAIEWEEAMEEGLNWYKKGLAKIKHGIPEFDLIRAKGMTNLGVLLIFLGERVSAVDIMQGSLALYRSINPQDKRGWLETHSRLVGAYIDYDSSVAISNAKASVALARSLGPEGIWELGTALYWDGVVSLRQREYETAKSRTQESLTIFRQLGDNIWVAHMLELLGLIERDQGNFEAARLYHEQSRDIYLALTMKRNEINALWYLASIARRTGHFDSARITLEEVIIYYRDKGLKNDLARSLWELGETLFRLGETAQATRTLQESLELLLHITHPRYKSYGLFTLAQAFHHQENNVDAARLLGAIEVEVRKDLWQLYAPRMADYNQTMEAIKTALGEGAYTIAYAEGLAMTLDQAISYVLELPL